MAFSSPAGAQLLPSTISGSVTAAAEGYNTGPGPLPTISLTLGVPASGSASAQVYSTPFSVGLGALGGTLGGGFSSASVDLGPLTNNSDTLSASANFGFVPFGESDGVIVDPSYAFTQAIDVVYAAQYSLQMSVTRPVYQGVMTASPGGMVYMPAPSETFSGPGTSLTLTGEYYDPSNPELPGPMTLTQTYTGILQPGVYTFASSWTTPDIIYPTGSTPGVNNIAGVTASLSLSTVPVPEPASMSLAVIAMGLLARRKSRQA